MKNIMIAIVILLTMGLFMMDADTGKENIVFYQGKQVYLSINTGSTFHNEKLPCMDYRPGQEKILATKDFNGDGKDDILVYEISSRKIQVWYNRDGKFLSKDFEKEWLWLDKAENFLDAGCFNNDKKADVLLLHQNIMRAFCNQGLDFKNKSGKANWLSLASTEIFLAAGDFNGNGLDDTLILHQPSKQMQVWWNSGQDFRGAGSGKPWKKYDPEQEQFLAVGDFNGDGKDDLLLWNKSSKKIQVHFNTGQNFEQQGKVWRDYQKTEEFVAAGDYNGDGKDDLLFADKDLQPLGQVKISFQDKEQMDSWGNGDGIVNTFETIRLQVQITDHSKRLSIDGVEPVLPAGTSLIATSTDEFDSQTIFSFSIVVGPKFQKESLSFSVHLKQQNKLIKTVSFTAPFVQIDLAKRYLQKEKVIQSKKFDYSSRQELDEFLANFPKSQLAPVAFRLRLECCRRFRDQILNKNLSCKTKKEKEANLILAINEYNEFIEKYPDRVLSRIAIHECFDLYQKINRISFYYNFIERYPYAEHSLIARERIKLLIYQLTCKQDTVFSYEKFLELYPEPSIYRTQSINLAIKKALGQEKKISDSLKTPQDRNQRANEWMHKLLQIRQEYKKLPVDERVQKIARDTRILRIKEIISNLYSDTFAIHTVLILEDLQDIKQLNQQLHKLLQKQHQEVMLSLDNHFDSLEQNLDKKFKNVDKQLAGLKADVGKLRKDIKFLHSEMNQKFTHVEKQLQVIHEDLCNFTNSLARMDSNIVHLSQTDQNFLMQQAGKYIPIDKNGKIYSGYQNYPKSKSHRLIKKIVVKTLHIGVALIPKVGPILSVVATPAIDWLGEEVAEETTHLWRETF